MRGWTSGSREGLPLSGRAGSRPPGRVGVHRPGRLRPPGTGPRRHGHGTLRRRGAPVSRRAASTIASAARTAVAMATASAGEVTEDHAARRVVRDHDMRPIIRPARDPEDHAIRWAGRAATRPGGRVRRVAFSRYISASAARIMPSRRRIAVVPPMLASIWTNRPSMRIGAISANRSRAATSAASRRPCRAAGRRTRRREPGDQVAVAGVRAQPGGDDPQELVAGLVAEGVVDRFEAVEVQVRAATWGRPGVRPVPGCARRAGCGWAGRSAGRAAPGGAAPRGPRRAGACECGGRVTAGRPGRRRPGAGPGPG